MSSSHGSRPLPTPPPHGRGARRGRPARPEHEDPYAEPRKAGAALVCTSCGVLHHAGRWSWGEAPVGPVRETLCPACMRVRDGLPGGLLHLDRSYLAQREPLERIARKLEQDERREHPLERLIAFVEDEHGLTLTTTGIHLARRIAGRVARTYHRRPAIAYREDPPSVEIRFGG